MLVVFGSGVVEMMVNSFPSADSSTKWCLIVCHSAFVFLLIALFFGAATKSSAHGRIRAIAVGAPGIALAVLTGIVNVCLRNHDKSQDLLWVLVCLASHVPWTVFFLLMGNSFSIPGYETVSMLEPETVPVT
jgi:hypothetical protein